MELSYWSMSRASCAPVYETPARPMTIIHSKNAATDREGWPRSLHSNTVPIWPSGIESETPAYEYTEIAKPSRQISEKTVHPLLA